MTKIKKQIEMIKDNLQIWLNAVKIIFYMNIRIIALGTLFRFLYEFYHYEGDHLHKCYYTESDRYEGLLVFLDQKIKGKEVTLKQIHTERWAEKKAYIQQSLKDFHENRTEPDWFD
jgi:hypothetical protein